jgi:putative transposase
VNGKVQSYLFIRKHAEKYPITRLVQITGVSRSGYYKWVKRNGENRQDIEDEKLRPILTKIFEEEHGLIGRKRMKLALFEQHNLVMNEKRVRRLMLKYGLYCKIRRKRFKHQPDPHAIIPNILNRNFKAVRPGIKFFYRYYVYSCVPW